MKFLIINFLSMIRLGINFVMGKDYPFVVVSRLNDACNMACNYCDSYKLSKSIDFDLLETFLNKAYQKGCRSFIFTGGEPYLYKDLPRLKEWVKSKKKIYLIINTNGKLIAKQDYREFLTLADEVLISLDGPEEINDLQRGKGSYSNVIETLKFLRHSKIKRTISAVLTRNNLNENVLDHIKNLKTEFDARVGLNPVTPNGRINSTDYSNDNALTVEQLRLLGTYVKKHKKIFPETPSLLIDYYINPHSFNCKTKKFAIYVDVNHGLYPCINVTDRDDARLGHMKDYGKLSPKNVFCAECNCTPLIVGNIMMNSNHRDKPKHIKAILSRFF